MSNEESQSEDMTAAASLSLGDSYFVDDNFSEAVDAYAAALSLVRDSQAGVRIRALSHRSAAFLNLGRFDEALEDATAAVSLLSDSALRPGEGETCHKRAGVAALRLKRFAEAKTLLGQAAQLAGLNGRPTAQYEAWIEECDDALAPPPATATATAPAKKPAENKAAPALAMPPSNPKKLPAPAAAASAPSSAKRPVRPKYQWWQNEKFVTIALLVANVSEPDLGVSFAEKDITIRLTRDGEEFVVVAGTTYGTIDPQSSKVQIKDEKVLVKMRKAEKSEWHDLLSKEKPKSKPVEAPAAAAVEAADSSPKPVPVVKDSEKARPYASHRDWDAIEKDLTEEEKNEKPEGDAAMNALFQTLYKDADPDTRRAMIKSYQTSGGTVLSTNWDEVKKTDYEKERTAPKGQEWKNWEGDKLPTKDDD